MNPFKHVSGILKQAEYGYLPGEHYTACAIADPDCDMHFQRGFDVFTDKQGFLCLRYKTLCACALENPMLLLFETVRALIHWRLLLENEGITCTFMGTHKMYLRTDLQQGDQPLFADIVTIVPLESEQK